MFNPTPTAPIPQAVMLANEEGAEKTAQPSKHQGAK
jgi:hypothetical protein